MVHGHEGTKRCLVLYGSEISIILCVIAEKINNMLLCVKIRLICTFLMYQHRNWNEWELYVGNIIIRNL